MTLTEFNDQFDVLYNSITSNQAPGLDEYEKSVFLTKAQDEIIRRYFDPKNNKVAEGFDSSRKRQQDFSKLIKTIKPTKVDEANIEKFDDRSTAYAVPNDLLLFINESYTTNGNKHTVIPISYQEYDKLMQKPYQRPPKKAAWRLITNAYSPTITRTHDIRSDKFSFTNVSSKYINLDISFYRSTRTDLTTGKISIEEGQNEFNIKMEINLDYNTGGVGDTTIDYYNTNIKSNTNLQSILLVNEWPSIILGQLSNSSTSYNFTIKIPCQSNVVELISNTSNPTDSSYTIRYIKRPKPIVVHDIAPLTIDGVSTTSDCELDESLHQEILQRAVELAKAVYAGDLTSTIAVGANSQTDIGNISQPSSK